MREGEKSTKRQRKETEDGDREGKKAIGRGEKEEEKNVQRTGRK